MCRAWKVIALAIAIRQRAVTLRMECTLKTLGSPLCSSGAVGSLVRAAANMRWGHWGICFYGKETRYHPLKKTKKKQVLLLLHTFLCGANEASWLSGQHWVAEWSPVNFAMRVLFSVPLHLSFFLAPRPRHYRTPPNTGGKLFLSGRLVSVGTLPMMVSTLGQGFLVLIRD